MIDTSQMLLFYVQIILTSNKLTSWYFVKHAVYIWICYPEEEKRKHRLDSNQDAE